MRELPINPESLDFLAAHGLRSAGDFLELPGLVIAGHPERHVRRVTIGGQCFFLKREHRVSWLDRWANFRAGFGFVSKSLREARLLRELRQAGVHVPEVIAAGEDGHGRAFVLLREVRDAVELRTFLQKCSSLKRLRFARRLGETLAQLHQAGFEHADLYAKHVFVDAEERIYFFDWQRGRRRRGLSWRLRCRELALLDATVAEELASPRARLRCLAAYLRAQPAPAEVLRHIQRLRRRLLRRRGVREMRRQPPSLVSQGVYWLDGEARCVTREFWDETRGDVQDWMGRETLLAGNGVRRVALPNGGEGELVCRRQARLLHWLWQRCRQKSLVSPEIRRAGELLRLQRLGIAAPRLLAFGQRQRGWRTDSFLLTETGPFAGSASDGTSAGSASDGNTEAD